MGATLAPGAFNCTVGAGADGAEGAAAPDAGLSGIVGAGAGALGAPPAGFSGIVGAGAPGALAAFFPEGSGAFLSSSLMARILEILAWAGQRMPAVAGCRDLREAGHGVSNPQAENKALISPEGIFEPNLAQIYSFGGSDPSLNCNNFETSHFYVVRINLRSIQGEL